MGSQGSSKLTNKFFLSLIEKENVLYILPTNISLTWRNKRVGEERVEKILDRFLISKKLMGTWIWIRQWAGVGGEPNHSPIFLEMAVGLRKLASSFNFNSKWLKEEIFISLVKEH
jgi:hypothetical protein